MALSLAKEYQGLFGEAPLRTPEGAAVADEVGDRRRKLVFELNRSGRYLEMKQRLKKSVIAIVKEKFHKSGSMDKSEMMDIYNSLYTHLVDQMHGVLNQLAADEAPPPEAAPPSAHKLAALEQLAAECEVCGMTARAEKLHQERMLEDKVPDVWHTYGAFCARAGDPSKAEECFRQALALDAAFLPSLLALGCLLWHNGTFTDAMYLEDAEVVACHTVELHPQSSIAWALLTMVYKAQGTESAAGSTRARNAQFQAGNVADACFAASRQPLDAHPFLQLEILLLDLHLGSLALQAHVLAAEAPGAASLSELPICEAQALGLVGEPGRAVDLLEGAARAAGEGDVKPLVLLGHMHARAGAPAAAIKAYEAALRKAPTGCPLDVYIRLGDGYLAAGLLEDALAVFGQACTARPCASAWLGAGKSYLGLKDLGNADLCFTEANIHDNQHPLVWGYLALVQLLSENDFEADQALRLGYRCGFDDYALLKEIGGLYVKQGKYSTAIPVLQRAAAGGAQEASVFEIHALLGDALTEVGDLEAATRQWEIVRLSAPPESQGDALASAALHALRQRTGR